MDEFADEDPFTRASAGRSWFRPDYLVQLSVRLAEIGQEAAP